MKTTFKYIVTSFAVCAALVSCQKDNITGNADDKPAVGKARVIEAHFGTATKSYLGGDNGVTPLFNDGDKIRVSNETSNVECTVSVDDNGKATFTTTLTGALTAVYPSDAAKLNGNVIDGVAVPAEQDGTFAKANIAKATIASDATSATFENQTSVLRFYVDKSIGVKSITITATGNANIAEESKTIEVKDPNGDKALDEVTDDSGKRICYVSVLPGTFTSLKFTSVTTTQTLCKDNTVERTASNVTLAAKKIYNAFVPYYIDLGAAGMWGYCNVGAFLPEDAGEFFAWGEISGHRPATNGEKAFAFGNENAGFAADFSNCPYYSGGNNFTKYIPTGYKANWGGTGDPDNLTILEGVDDAAIANWGNGWRMPKISEFTALIDLTSQKSESGYSFGTSPDTIFLPAAGKGVNTKLEGPGDCGMYWSSSLNNSAPTNGNALEFGGSTTPNTTYNARSLGCTIRPVRVVTVDNPIPTDTDFEQDLF